MEERSIRSKWIASLVDDYSNQIITDNRAGITIDRQKAHIVKKEGYHIFTDIPEEGLLETTGGLYQKRTRLLPKESRPEGVFYIRLLPDKGYVTRQSMTIITGKGRTGRKIYLRFVNPLHPYLLLAADKERPLVKIYNEEDFFLEDKVFLVETEGNRERFRILRRVYRPMEGRHSMEGRHPMEGRHSREKGKTWVTDRSLQFSHNPHTAMEERHSMVKREYCVETDAKGDFYFLVPEEFADTKTVELETDGQVSQRQFHKGKSNFLEISEGKEC